MKNSVKSDFGCHILSAAVAWSAIFGLGTLTVPAGQVLAQGSIEEITVTARKREESLMDISASISVVDSQTLERFKLDNFEAIADFIPNVTFNAAPSGTPVIAVRGIGTRAGGAMLEQDVGLFVDGVWVGRQNQLTASQYDVERIEILRGTQATLYGRNTLVGAVSVTTRKPTDELDGYVSAGYESEYDSFSLEGAIGGPVSDNFGLRLAAKYDDLGGWLTNTTVGREEPQRENTALRLTGVYESDGGATVTGKVQWSDQEQIGNSFVRLIDGTFTEFDGTTTLAPAAPSASAAGGFNETAFGTTISIPALGNSDVGSSREFIDVAVQIDFPIGEQTLTSITGFSDMQYNSVFDPTILGGPRVLTWYDEDYRQFTQEIRLTSPGGQSFDYIVGAYFVDQDIDRINFQYLNATDRFWYGEQRLKALSVFASGTFTVSDAVRLVGGLRYTSEEKDADIIVHGNTNADLDFAADTDTADTDAVDGSLTVEWDLSDETLLFAGVSKGSKKPGLASGNPVRNTDFVNPGPLFIPESETVTSEIGAKFALSAGYINVTTFNMDIDGFQQATFTNGNLRIDSIDIASQGIEVEAFFQLGAAWSTILSIGIQDVENKDAPAGANTDVPGAPGFSANATLNWDQQDLFSGVDGFANLNINHKGEHFLNATNGAGNALNEIDGVTLVNLTLGVTWVESNVEASIFAKNLTDEDYADFSFNAPGPSNDFMFAVGQPRTIGMSLRKSF